LKNIFGGYFGGGDEVNDETTLSIKNKSSLLQVLLADFKRSRKAKNCKNILQTSTNDF